MAIRSGPALALLLALSVSACADADPAPVERRAAATEVTRSPSAAPPSAAPSDEAADGDVLPAAGSDVARLGVRAERERALAEHRAEQARRAAEEEARRRAETLQVQEVLAAQGYYAGAIDGEAGPATTGAVLAFQKVHGLTRDGVIGPATLAAIGSPQPPPLQGGAPTRIEVDLDRQVVHLVRNGERVRTMNASSGNGEVYTWPDGRVARADTPVGTFTILRRINGLRDGDLGAMFDPMYFHEGWAIHGSNSVPAYPASHGCVRLSRSDALWVAAQVPNGTQVVVHGSVNAFDPRTESVWLPRG